jgi:hypothetical protein
MPQVGLLIFLPAPQLSQLEPQEILDIQGPGCLLGLNVQYNGCLFTRAMKEGTNLKPTVIPSKSHTIAHRVLYWSGIFGWYQLVFSQYLPYQYQRISWLVHFGIKMFAGAPFVLQKGGLWTPFVALSPPFEGKRVSRGFFQKKEFPETSKRVPAKSYTTKNTNRILPTNSAGTIPI